MHKNRTDLAMERINPDEDYPGVEIHSWNETDIDISEVIIHSDEAAQTLGKPCGNYLTMECRLLAEHDPDARIAVSNLLGEELFKMLPQDEHAPVLVVGLGNRDVTPDSLGPLTIEKTLVTRHIMDGVHSPADLRSVCAVAPGVLGVTGMETCDIVKGAVDHAKPAAVICVDALAARECSRIGTTVQLTDTGILPGSGVGNHRQGLTKDTLGVPVIAIGVPLVVYTAVIVRDALNILLNDMEEDEESRNVAADSLINRIIGEDIGEMVVTPREIDEMVSSLSNVLALSLNIALQSRLSRDEIIMLTHETQ